MKSGGQARNGEIFDPALAGGPARPWRRHTIRNTPTEPWLLAPFSPHEGCFQRAHRTQLWPTARPRPDMVRKFGSIGGKLPFRVRAFAPSAITSAGGHCWHLRTARPMPREAASGGERLPSNSSPGATHHSFGCEHTGVRTDLCELAHRFHELEPQRTRNVVNLHRTQRPGNPCLRTCERTFGAHDRRCAS